MTVRLASVNLFSGRSLLDGRVDDVRVTDAVAGLGADVVALQEVDVGQPRSGGADQAALVAEAVGAVAHRFVPLVAGTPGESAWTPADQAAAGTPDGPLYGIALVSRRPVAGWHVLPLSPARGRWPMPVPSPPPRVMPRVMWLRDEPRAAVAAVLAEPRIVVACTHLSFVPGVNVGQLRRVRAWLADLAAREGAPLVLLGDLNLPGRLPARITGWTPLVTGPTFPAPAPRTQVDHALTHGRARARGGGAGGDHDNGLTGVGRVVPLAFSDHRAVVVDLRAD